MEALNNLLVETLNKIIIKDIDNNIVGNGEGIKIDFAEANNV